MPRASCSNRIKAIVDYRLVKNLGQVCVAQLTKLDTFLTLVDVRFSPLKTLLLLHSVPFFQWSYLCKILSLVYLVLNICFSWNNRCDENKCYGMGNTGSNMYFRSALLHCSTGVRLI